MKLLLDQGLPRFAVALLARHGIDAVHVGDIAMATAEDSIILAKARSDARAVVTLDADFHADLALSGATRPSVIRIRVEGLRAEPLTELLLRVLNQCGDDLRTGALVSVESSRIRVHRLPIVKP